MSADLILLAASNGPDSSQVIDKHLHGYATIQYVENIRGALCLSYDEQRYEFNEGQWFFPAHPGPRLYFGPRKSGDAWHHRHIGFSGPRVEQWRTSGVWLENPQRAPEGENWAARVDELIDWARRGDQLARARAINGIERLLLELAEARAPVREPNPWLEDILSRLERDYTPNLSKVVGEIGLSETALRRRFKAATGQTMQEWVLDRRISAARVLLADSDLPLKAIAAQLGYANEYFFSRQFKGLTGIAPGAFRKSRLRA